MVESGAVSVLGSTRSQQRRRLALIASLAAALLAIGVVVVVQHDKQARSGGPWLTPPAQRIAVKRPGHPDYVMQRIDAQWRISEPCALAVNQQRLTPLLEALYFPTIQYRADEVDLEAAGLLSPLARLDVNDQTVIIGATDVSGERRYVQFDNHIRLVPEWILSLVDGGLSAFANSALFDKTITSAVSGEEVLNTEAWSALAAVQTVPWPLDEEPEDASSSEVDIGLADGSSYRLNLSRSSAWDAVVVDEQACARLLPAGALDAALTSQGADDTP